MEEDILNIILMLSRKNIEITLTINGTSMLPRYSSGEKVCIRKAEKYILGDIIAFKYESDGIILHRIVKKIGNYIYCKGDNSFRLEIIKKDDIIGKVIEKKYMKQRLGKIRKKVLCLLSYRIGEKFMQTNMDMSIQKSIGYRFYRICFLNSKWNRIHA